MIETLISWVTRVFFIAIFLLLGYWAVTHAALCAHIVVVVINAIVTFAQGLINGVSSIVT